MLQSTQEEMKKQRREFAGHRGGGGGILCLVETYSLQKVVKHVGGKGRETYICS